MGFLELQAAREASNEFRIPFVGTAGSQAKVSYLWLSLEQFPRFPKRSDNEGQKRWKTETFYN